MTVLMLSPMDPRCTGICGALAMRLPSWSKSAHEKSRRSLILTEKAVLERVAPICSAMDIKRLLKISSITGSTSVPIATVFSLALRRESNCSPPLKISICHSGSIIVVPLASKIIAGPSMRIPALSSSRL